MGQRFYILPVLVLFRFFLLPVFAPVPPVPATGKAGAQKSLRVHKRRADETYTAHSFSHAAMREDSAAEDRIARRRYPSAPRAAENLSGINDLRCSQVHPWFNFPLFLLIRSIRI